MTYKQLNHMALLLSPAIYLYTSAIFYFLSFCCHCPYHFFCLKHLFFCFLVFFFTFLPANSYSYISNPSQTLQAGRDSLIFGPPSTCASLTKPLSLCSPITWLPLCLPHYYVNYLKPGTAPIFLTILCPVPDRRCGISI